MCLALAKGQRGNDSRLRLELAVWRLEMIMSRKRPGLALMACFSLLGCDQIQAVDCADSDTLVLVEELLKDDVASQVRKVLGEAGYSVATTETIMGALGSIEIGLKSVRTISLDKDLGIRSCAAELEISFPQNVLDDADEALAYISYSDVDALAEVAGFRSRGRAFTNELEFEMQPTDSDEGLYVEILDVAPSNLLMAYVTASHLVLPEIRSREAIETAEAERRERELTEAQEAAAAARLSEANAQKTLSEQSINAVWRALPEKVREDLLQVQRAWIRRKTAECQLQGASATIEVVGQQAIAAQCEERYNRNRERELRQYLSF